MDVDFLIFALREGIKTVLSIITPLMLIPMIAGLLISIFQAVTQIQDQLVGFLLKLVIMLSMIMAGTPYALNTLGNYFNNVLQMLPSYI